VTVLVRRYTLAALAGLSLYLAHPPARVWPAALLVVPLLLGAVVESERGRQAALSGLIAGIVGFAPMLWWLVLPAGVVAWMLLTLSQALAVALFAWTVHRWVRSHWIVVVAPLVWTGAEAWRAAVPLGGFGWGELAYAAVDSGWLLPLARIGGGRLLTLVVVIIGTLVFDAYRRARVALEGLPGTARDRIAASLPHAQPALLGLGGVLVLVALAAPEAPPESGTVDVLAVQGNDLPDSDLPAREEDRVIATNLLDETRASVERDGVPDLTVWPESGVDRDPYAPVGEDLRPILDEAAALAGGLVTGAILVGPRPDTFRNTAVVVGPDGEPVDHYHKRHLVPFGEFVPWRSVLGGLPPLRQVPRDGVPGDEARPVATDGLRMAVAICFETVFPRLVRENVLGGGQPAQLLLATTNDASFGDSAEPAQHLAQSRLRAVETGRWVVHASLAGGSAFVDPAGRAHDVTPLFTSTSIRRDIGVVDELTLFLRVGDVVGLAAQGVAALLLALAVVARIRRPKAPEVHP
jgi:apolipoprotein N-acyltransferase